MKIALFHNYYQTPGGEDRMFELEREALTARGNEVVSYEVRNDEILSNSSRIKKMDIARKAAFNKDSYRDIMEFLGDNDVDISHVHNWFPIISPAIYAAHKQLSIPVVQTLHNYRLGCANGTFRRNGSSCDLCLSGKRSNAVLHRCYKGSFAGSYAWKRMVERSWRNGLFTRDVAAYVSPSEEVARVHMQMGLPQSKIHIIGNACPDPSRKARPSIGESTPSALYLGRLSREKGVDTLIDSWQGVESKLLIAGSGPEETSLRKRAANNPDIRFLGQIPPNQAQRYLQDAAFLVFPSRWAEPFGLSIIEAMAAGKPVVASKIGGPSVIIQDGVNGLLVPPGETKALRDAIAFLGANPKRRQEMGERARQTYLQNYLPSEHGRRLENLYRSLIQARTHGSN